MDADVTKVNELMDDFLQEKEDINTAKGKKKEEDVQ